MPRQPMMKEGVARFDMRLCRHCGYPFNAMSPVKGRPAMPKPGDIAICLNCAAVSVMAEDGIIQRDLTREEQIAFDRGEAQWAKARKAVELIKRSGIRTQYAQRGPGRAH